jgi:hypothetical protein
MCLPGAFLRRLKPGLRPPVEVDDAPVTKGRSRMVNAALAVDNESQGANDRQGLFRLWVEFDIEPAFGLVAGQAVGWAGGPPIWAQGCGVSGYDEVDCLRLLSDVLFGGRPLPPLRRSIPSIHVSALPDRVRARVGVPVYRGVWFPPLNRRPPA